MQSETIKLVMLWPFYGLKQNKFLVMLVILNKSSPGKTILF